MARTKKDKRLNLITSQLSNAKDCIEKQKVLEKYKKTLPKMIQYRISPHTVIELPASMSKKEVKQRIENAKANRNIG